jgi:hypothetical protein
MIFGPCLWSRIIKEKGTKIKGKRKEEKEEKRKGGRDNILHL